MGNQQQTGTTPGTPPARPHPGYALEQYPRIVKVHDIDLDAAALLHEGQHGADAVVRDDDGGQHHRLHVLRHQVRQREVAGPLGFERGPVGQRLRVTRGQEQRRLNGCPRRCPRHGSQRTSV